MSDAEDLQINWGPAHTQSADEPMVHIRADGDAWVNAAAGEQYFDDDEVAVGAAPDAGLLVFDPGAEQTDQTLSLHRSDGGDGGELSCTSRTRQVVDLDTLEETLRVPLEERTDGLLVADVQAALAGDVTAEDVAVNEADEPTVSQAAPESSGSYSTPDESDEEPEDLLAETHSSQPLVEYYLVDALSQGERKFVASEVADAMDSDVGSRQVGFALSGLKDADESPLDVRKTDETTDNGAMVWRVEPSAELAAKLDHERGGVALESVLGEDVESVQELAEALDVEEGEARRRAMDAGVYADLQDNIKRPGVRD